MIKREQILTGIFNDKKIKDTINNIVKDNRTYVDDLFSELLVILCEMELTKLFDLWSSKEIYYWVSRTVSNMWNSQTSSFYYKYRKENIEKIDANIEYNALDQFVKEEIDEDFNNHKLLDKLEAEIDKLYWYDRDILKYYLQLDNKIVNVSRRLDISPEHIAKSIKKSKQIIVHNLKIKPSKSKMKTNKSYKDEKYIAPKLYSSQHEEFKELKQYLLKKYNITDTTPVGVIKLVMLDSDWNKYQLNLRRMGETFNFESKQVKLNSI